jgi:hypothetical protein
MNYVRNVCFEDKPNYAFLRHPTRYPYRRHDHRVLGLDSITRDKVKKRGKSDFQKSIIFRETTLPNPIHLFVVQKEFYSTRQEET